MNLHSVTLSVALLVSTTAIAQDVPAGTKAAQAQQAEQAAQTDDPAKPAVTPTVKRRLPQLDNPLDPNRPPKSTREPAKIRPAEHGAPPAENVKKVTRDGKAKAARKAAEPSEPAKIRPAESAVTPAENTDKVDKAIKPGKKEGRPDDSATDAAPDQASRPATAPGSAPATRRAVTMTVDGMPAAAPSATYGPRLNAQQGMSANAPTNFPTTAIAPSRPLAPANPAIVNSCDAGGCTDTNGVRYQGGVGSTMIGPQGQACRHNGVTMQC